MDNPILFIVGHPGVGKSTFAKIYSDISREKAINSGEILRRKFQESDVHVSYRGVGNLAINELGESGVASLIMNEVVKTRSSIIDGVRLFSTYNKFIECGLKVDVLMLELDEITRKSRIEKRYRLSNVGELNIRDDIHEKEYLWEDDWKKYFKVKTWEYENGDNEESLRKFAEYLFKQRSK